MPLGEKEVLSRLKLVRDLPALPTVVNSLTTRMSNPKASAGDVARLLVHDQALTARVLRLANSAFYSPKEPVRSPEHAVVLLGLGTVRAIVLKASIFSAYELSEAQPFWLHALGVACAARAIAKLAKLGRADEAFVMGLLHDIGKLALAEYLPKEYQQVRALVARDGGLIRSAEMSVLGCDHTVAGRFLAEHWSLPKDYRDAIAAHHDLAAATPEARPWAACIHLADIVARAMLVGNGGDNAMPVIERAALDTLKLDENRFAEIFRASEDELGRAEVFFTIING